MNKSSNFFELIHVDLWGPYRTPSHSGARYFLTIVDDYSRGVWLYLLTTKSEAPEQLKKFCALTERQFNTKIKRIRSDNGIEFLCLTEYFLTNGIIHETSCVATPQQNARAERKHRHILNVARALRFQASLPIEFWGECVLTAAYLINRTPSSVLDFATPFERLFNKVPTYDHIRVFGSLCYAHDQNKSGDKFASRSKRCVFVGYPYEKKGWRLYDLEKLEFFVSRDVVFSETQFPFAPINHLQASDESKALWAPISEFLENDDCGLRKPNPIRSVALGPVSSSQLPTPISSANDTRRSENSDGDNGGARQLPDPTAGDEILPSTAPNPIPVAPTSRLTPAAVVMPPVLTEELLGKGKRNRTPSVHLKDFVVPHAPKPKQQEEINLVYAENLTHNVDVHRFSETLVAYVAAVLSNLEPRSFKQAMQEEKWRNAVGSEYGALEENNTWTIEDLPPNKKAIGSQWIFKVKFKSDGTIERYKARLVAMGNKQIEGEDYGETFSPVVKMGTVRLFLDIDVKKGWIIHQMDVHNAFLHGDLEEEVYMKLPPGFEFVDKNKVCRLRKSLYGLKQAPRCWFAKLTSALLEYGFQQSRSDYSLFTYAQGTTRLNILVYVDDLVIAGSSLKATKSFKAYLSSCFHMKDLGKLKYFLGIEVARNASGIYLCQRKYALDIITETDQLGAKPAHFPLEANHKLALSESVLLHDPKPYRRLLGRLIYLGVTRPDLAFSVHVLAQFVQNPRLDHWLTTLRLIRYLKSDPGQGILLRADGNFQVTGWCDADWDNCPITRCSVTGYFVQLGDSPISWKTKKQKTVSLSSAEAEYRALAKLVQELIWIKMMLKTLGVVHTQPMLVQCDSKSAIYIATNPVFHERTKHIEIDLHFVRDEVLKREIQLCHVDSFSQLADILTKPIGKDGFRYFKSKLGTLNLYSPA